MKKKTMFKQKETTIFELKEKQKEGLAKESAGKILMLISPFGFIQMKIGIILQCETFLSVSLCN